MLGGKGGGKNGAPRAYEYRANKCGSESRTLRNAGVYGMTAEKRAWAAGRVRSDSRAAKDGWEHLVVFEAGFNAMILLYTDSFFAFDELHVLSTLAWAEQRPTEEMVLRGIITLGAGTAALAGRVTAAMLFFIL